LQGKAYLFIYKLTPFNNNNMMKAFTGKEQRVSFFFCLAPSDLLFPLPLKLLEFA